MSNGSISLGPYINFQGRSREAMEFYQRVLGGKVELQTYDQRGASGPAGAGDRVIHAQLDLVDASIVGSDGHPKYPPTVGDNLAVALHGTDGERVTRIFNGLAEGGTVKGRITAQPGGGAAGYLLDKFGVNWIVTIG